MTFKQIAVGQYTTKPNELNFAVVGLGEDGNVYQHRFGKGWLPIGEGGKAPVSYPGKPTTSKDEPW